MTAAQRKERGYRERCESKIRYERNKNEWKRGALDEPLQELTPFKGTDLRIRHRGGRAPSRKACGRCPWSGPVSIWHYAGQSRDPVQRGDLYRVHPSIAEWKRC